MSAILDVVSHPLLGSTAIAPRPFRCGEEVLREAPVLTVMKGDALDTDLVGTLSQLSGVEGDQWGPLAASRRLPPATLEWLIRHLHSPLRRRPQPGEPADPSAVYPHQGELRAVTVALSGLFDSFFAASPSAAVWRGFRERILDETTRAEAAFQVVSFVHACRINIHQSGSSGMSMVFPTACKFAHSCNPNTIWALREEGGCVEGVHFATRDIKEGELLTFSYVGAGMNLLSDTQGRRMILGALHFDCGCPRCQQSLEWDHTRTLECKACHRRALGYSSNAGRGSMWRCHNCSATPSPQLLAQLLNDESLLEGLVMMVCFGRPMPTATASQMDHDGALLRRLAELSGEQPSRVHVVKEEWNPIGVRFGCVALVKEVLGTDHFLFILSCASLLKSLSMAVEARHPLPKDMGSLVPALKAHIVHGDEWFSTHCKLSPHHNLFWCWSASVLQGLGADATIPVAERDALMVFAKDHCGDDNVPLLNAKALNIWPEFHK